jgi:hypothetical protein
MPPGSSTALWEAPVAIYAPSTLDGVRPVERTGDALDEPTTEFAIDELGNLMEVESD